MTISHQQKTILIDYMRMKILEEDWHGVADAAMDLREVELKIKFERDLEVKFNIHPPINK